MICRPEPELLINGVGAVAWVLYMIDPGNSEMILLCRVGLSFEIRGFNG